jgi:hypothetical protein
MSLCFTTCIGQAHDVLAKRMDFCLGFWGFFLWFRLVAFGVCLCSRCILVLQIELAMSLWDEIAELEKQIEKLEMSNMELLQFLENEDDQLYRDSIEENKILIIAKSEKVVFFFCVIVCCVANCLLGCCSKSLFGEGSRLLVAAIEGIVCDGD